MSDDIMKMMEQDFEDTLATSVEKVDQEGLTSIAALARQIRDKEDRIKSLEDDLKAEKKALRRLHCAVREAAGWKGFKYRLANHKDWTSRKIDTQYSWMWLLRGARRVWSRQSFGL